MNYYFSCRTVERWNYFLSCFSDRSCLRWQVFGTKLLASRRSLLLLLFLLLVPVCLSAANLVKFSFEVEQMVAADQAVAEFSVTRQELRVADASRVVNNDMSWVKQQVDELPSVVFRIKSYNTRAIYSNRSANDIDGWEVKQSFTLSGEDYKLLAELAGRLQIRAELNDIRMVLSAELYQQAMKSLRKTALLEFRQRAGQIISELSYSGFEIEELELRPQRANNSARLSYASSARMTTAASLPVIVDDGEQKISLSVSASITLTNQQLTSCFTDSR